MGSGLQQKKKSFWREKWKPDRYDVVIIDDKKYLTIGALRKLKTIDASAPKIEKIIRENNIQGVKAKSEMGKIRDFYPVEEIKKHTNVNEDLPRTNEI